MASTDEDVIIEDEPDHPEILGNKDPQMLWSVHKYVWTLFEGNGYFIVLGAIMTYFLYQRLLDYLEKKASQSKTQEAQNLSPDEQMSRLEGIRKAREKLQSEVDQQSAVESEKIKERQDKQRKEKIEDWERHKQGLGQKSKSKPSPQKPIRPSYDLLGGGGGSGDSRYRPSRPSRGGGGGG